MADASPYDIEPPRRPRRGPPPRLYVIARRSPVSWLRVRRLGEADRSALSAHVRALAATERDAGRRAVAEDEALAACLATLDFGRTVAFGAMAANTIVAAACGVPGPAGLEVGITEDPRYREQGLGDMLMAQVLGARADGPSGEPGAGGGEPMLLRLIAGLGGRVVQDAAPAETG